jgi:hypothetical protein
VVQLLGAEPTSFTLDNMGRFLSARAVGESPALNYSGLISAVGGHSFLLDALLVRDTCTPSQHGLLAPECLTATAR